MNGLPLHPALVHVPIGLAMILPLLALAVAWAIRREKLPRRGWLLVIGLQAVVLAGAFAAQWAGDKEAERVKTVVPKAAIEEHEERADIFIWAAGLTLALAVAAMAVPGPRLRQVLVLGTVAGTVAVAGLAAWVGEAGGGLVHVYLVRHEVAMPGPGGVFRAGGVPLDGAKQGESDDP